MGGIGDALFGSSGSPAEVIDTTPSAWRSLRGPAAQGLRDIMSTQGGPQFEGPLSAPMSGNEQQLLQQAMQQASGAGLSGPAGQALGQTIQGQFLSPDSNPFLQQAIQSAQRPLIQQFQEQTMPQLRGEFTRAGQFVQPQSSSPFDMAAARAGSGLMDALGDVGTRMSFQNFAQERDRQLQAAQQAPAFDQAQLQRTVQGMEAQALPRMIEEMGIERGMQEFQQRMNRLMQAFQLSGQLGAPRSMQVGGTEGSPGLLGGFMGGAGRGLGAALGGSLFSDRRLKSRIEYVDTMPDGLNVYDYNVPWSDERRRGVLADEVRELYPEAVTTHSSGYDMVDYGALPQWHR